MESENIITIKEYFEKGTFVIPNYQRGYKWGVPNEEGNCAVSKLISDLIIAFDEPTKDYHIQGVTVYEKEEGKKIVLVDGQQRTTTFFLLLKYLENYKLPAFNYTIRKESNKVLKKISFDNFDIKYFAEKMDTEDFQDIFYFKKAFRTFNDKFNGKLNNKDWKRRFLEFILKKVKLFYIEIDEGQATKVFTMMNGQKSIMKTDELIKAKLLSMASRYNENEETNARKEWEINTLRSKYAREWDKWLYWWNRNEVKIFFYSGENPLGLLLEFYFELNKEVKEKYNFANFESQFLNQKSNPKIQFKKIRDLQKTFEDWYNNFDSYNYLGLILKTSNKESRTKAMLYFLKNDTNITLEEYAKWVLVGATHRQITESDKLEENEEAKESKAEVVLQNLQSKDVYGHHNEGALEQLLLRNVVLDNQLERKFDFELYGKKSLEHIYPKSWENEDDSKLNFNSQDYGVHSIGNLVLLDSSTNSSFSNLSFNKKKEKYFDSQNAKWSLKLLHSVSVFAKTEWGENEIIENQKNFINWLKDTYKL